MLLDSNRGCSQVVTGGMEWNPTPSLNNLVGGSDRWSYEKVKVPVNEDFRPYYFAIRERVFTMFYPQLV